MCTCARQISRVGNLLQNKEEPLIDGRTGRRAQSGSCLLSKQRDGRRRPDLPRSQAAAHAQATKPPVSLRLASVAPLLSVFQLAPASRTERRVGLARQVTVPRGRVPIHSWLNTTATGARCRQLAG
jgi:hypothetical protein